MLDFSSWLNLPLIWAGLIATAVILYVILDGFDLGVGILFPFAPTDRCRDSMMNSIAPFWDGNETWLVLGGGGLFAAFPLAYAIIMPALYLPIIFMLIGLIFRGVAFEFRYKADADRKIIWDYTFHFGSLLAAFMQGVILGGLVDGVVVEGRSFAGGAFDWLTTYSLMTGIAMIFGYALLGSTWLIMKTEGETMLWSRNTASYVLAFVGLFMFIVSVSMPVVNVNVRDFWFKLPNFFMLLPLVIISILTFLKLWRDLHQQKETSPFLLSILLFILAYIGLVISIWPWIVPYRVSIWDAAAASTSLSILLIGAVILLPTILAYTGYCYYIFRGKSSHDQTY